MLIYYVCVYAYNSVISVVIFLLGKSKICEILIAAISKIKKKSLNEIIWRNKNHIYLIGQILICLNYKYTFNVNIVKIDIQLFIYYSLDYCCIVIFVYKCVCGLVWHIDRWINALKITCLPSKITVRYLLLYLLINTPDETYVL